MKLADYLRRHELSEKEFAQKSGNAFSEEAVRKWRFGMRVPRPKQMVVILAVTDGQVTANDFYSPQAPSEGIA